MVVGLFWLGWSAKPGVHWIAPMLSGLAFGSGFLLIFMVRPSNTNGVQLDLILLITTDSDCRHC